MITVGDLCDHLDAEVPITWAEEWDRVGLRAGDRGAVVVKVFVTLDASASAVRRAAAAGADVLVTHHPAFLDPLEEVAAAPGGAGVPFAAAPPGIALIACHTNLDRSPEGADALPALLGLDVTGPLERFSVPESPTDRPLAGRLCSAGGARTLSVLAELVGSRLGVRTRVWGDPESAVDSVAIAPGSGRMLVEDAIAAGADALVTGELRYHVAHDALERGLAIIEAGHDATEWPLTERLAGIVARTPGLAAGAVVLDRPSCPWRTI